MVSSPRANSQIPPIIYEQVYWESDVETLRGSFILLKGWKYLPSTQKKIQDRLLLIKKIALWHITELYALRKRFSLFISAAEKSKPLDSLFLQALVKEASYLNNLLIKKNV